jgi:SHS2 domain-containing protein
MPFAYRGDIAHSDVAFDAWGKTLEELFRGAADATLQVMIEDPSALRPIERIEVALTLESEEMLLFDFLNELIFYKDARRLLLRPEHLSFQCVAEGVCSLKATLLGEVIDPSRHRLDTDVKAVTMLRFKVVRVADGWHATVVLDV